MIYVYKILPLIFSPIIVAITLIIIGVVWQRKKLSLFAVIFLYLASTPLVGEQVFRHIEENAVRQDPRRLPKADAIVVLSGMLMNVRSGDGDIAEWSDPDRFFGGIELYKLGKAEKLIFTGGKLPWQVHASPEGLILKEYAEMMGVPSNAILVSGEAQNTEQEAAEVRKLLPGEKPSILLVTSAFHMPRANSLFEKAGFDVHPYSVDFKVEAREVTLMDFFPSPRALWLTDIAVRERIGQTFYRIKHGFQSFF